MTGQELAKLGYQQVGESVLDVPKNLTRLNPKLAKECFEKEYLIITESKLIISLIE